MSKTIIAQAREAGSKGAAGRLRREGRVPAVVYGSKGQSSLISIDEREFKTQLKGVTESTAISIKIGGKEVQAICKDVQRDLLSGRIIHVDFFELVKDQKLHAKVPLHLVGNPIGVRAGGILEHAIHDIEVECLPKDLPEKIDVDVSGLDVNMSIHVRDLKLGDSIRVLSSEDMIVAAITHAKAEAAPAEAEAAAATAAPAAAPSAT
jgi:large subunit ribosomal protein L25